MLFILLGYGVLFYLLKRTGLDDAPGETIMAFGELIPWLFLGVKLVNWLFGTEFSDDAWALVWFSLLGIWTLVAIWSLIDEPRQRRMRKDRLRRLLNGEEV